VSEVDLVCVRVHEIVTSSTSLTAQVERLKGFDGVIGCIKRGLEGAVQSEDYWSFESYNAVAGHFPSVDYIPALTAALETLDRRFQLGDILLTLQEIPDSRAVQAVGKVLFWNPDWDDFDDLSFKAMDVLLSIDDQNSWRTISEAAGDAREQIREAALRLLAERGVSDAN
jgi:hypothetical protein